MLLINLPAIWKGFRKWIIGRTDTKAFQKVVTRNSQRVTRTLRSNLLLGVSIKGIKCTWLYRKFLLNAWQGFWTYPGGMRSGFHWSKKWICTNFILGRYIAKLWQCWGLNMRQMPNLFPYLQPHVLVCKYGIYHLCPTFTPQFLFFIYLFIFFFWAKYSVQGENLCNKLGWARATPTLVSLRGLILIFRGASPLLLYGSPHPPGKSVR